MSPRPSSPESHNLYNHAPVKREVPYQLRPVQKFTTTETKKTLPLKFLS